MFNQLLETLDNHEDILVEANWPQYQKIQFLNKWNKRISVVESDTPGHWLINKDNQTETVTYTELVIEIFGK